MTAGDFWKDQRRAARTSAEHARLTGLMSEADELQRAAAELCELTELDSGDLDRELAELAVELADRTGRLESALAPRGRYEHADATLVISAGAGGTEAHWWTEQLTGMYTAWARASGYELDAELDEGPLAGLRSATLTVRGAGAYRRLSAEAGVHRLSRVSDFDPSGRRHTSFARVEVLPIVDDTDVELSDSDLRFDYYRGSGPGGQHRNKTDSAVRVTHLPSGLVATCAAGRSQHQNKEQAVEVLRGRLAHAAETRRAAELAAQRGELPDAGFGQRIRSYVLTPYTLVTDHRTGLKTPDSAGVLAGDLDALIDAELARCAA